MSSAVKIPLYSAPQNVLKAILGEKNMVVIVHTCDQEVTVKHESNIYTFPFLQSTECTKARLQQHTLGKLRDKAKAKARRKLP
jgi:hypothetical protein